MKIKELMNNYDSAKNVEKGKGKYERMLKELLDHFDHNVSSFKLGINNFFLKY
jgi:hypothetical protein